ncbi:MULTISPECIES: WYL domain-containing protein [Muribaculum]|uniref:helix-turn-helix transcriptional regulator n=2 Tax=Muribaculaceae TaxID=2005473 RepID=UPI000F487191|nr:MULTISPECIES: WYL domain-containing protein [Muribaculum]MCX4276479.1 WYL domain-containing protein [Muribaculum sp.]ROT15968.1 WYL domain-containing protein [Muribaculaceae bacterium Isolate-102 (HZI)]TGY05141.1 WYL domain-containing protein [Muribaculum sp. NM65_B17]THG44621.1 WYL domain-containing protein [Muribaculaceae bacterium]
MARDLFSRYIWLIDTIRRYGSLTRDEINRLWMKSPYSNGEPLPRRTFYTYRNAIEELFKINIECNPSTFEYYIEQSNDHYESVMNWLLNSASIGNLLNDAHDIADSIFLENVPSAREFLSITVDSLKEHRPMKFDYHPYTRLNPTRDIVLEPYFLKIFKQRWYVTGRNVKEDVIKTYALDRMSEATLLPSVYEVPEDFDAEAYFRDSYGIIFDEGEVKHVAVRTDSRQAKYFRSVPLHASQQEVLHDSYSIFYFKIKITPDFVQELLSYGPKVTVLSPPELRAIMINNLREALAQY